LRLTSIRAALTSWYDRVRRDLPWRRTRDPYAIWISEIMLQQTRVAAVIPYYEKFLRAFPDVAALAHAPEDRVLTMWSGLGYYSRARNLQKAARQINQAGEFPREYDSIRALAGVGDYTAAAISSIAFGLPHAAVDGNVRRVIARLMNRDGAEDQASILLDHGDPGRWNQAMMELGATVCVPRDPQCGECPVAKHCQARRRGTQRQFPAKRVKPAPIRLARTLLLVRRRGRVLLEPSSRVKGFWDLPEKIDCANAGPICGRFRHTILHRHYRFTVQCAEVDSAPAGLRWFRESELDQIPLSTTARKALACRRKKVGQVPDLPAY